MLSNSPRIYEPPLVLWKMIIGPKYLGFVFPEAIVSNLEFLTITRDPGLKLKLIGCLFFPFSSCLMDSQRDVRTSSLTHCKSWVCFCNNFALVTIKSSMLTSESRLGAKYVASARLKGRRGSTPQAI